MNGRERHGGAHRPRARAMAVLAGLVTIVLAAAGAAPAFAATAPSIGYQQALAAVTSAMPEAEIDPNGSPTTCEVEYVSASAYASSEWAGAQRQPCVEALGAGTSEVHALAEVQGLASDTTYEYRFIARNAIDPVTGPEATFVTFGIASYGLGAGEEEVSEAEREKYWFGFKLAGAPFTVAGGHPDALVTHIELNVNPWHTLRKPEEELHEDATLKDVQVALPPGLVGNPTATSRCPRQVEEEQRCPPSAQVGAIEVVTGKGENSEKGSELYPEPLYSLVPPAGVAAEFGARFNGFASAIIQARVRTGSDYAVEADSLNIATITAIRGVTVKMWGVPAAAPHTPERVCQNNEPYNKKLTFGCASEEEAHPEPFLTMPTACVGALGSNASVDSYQGPGEFVSQLTQMPGMEGCSALQFNPSLEAAPTTTAADSPSGLNVNLTIPQDENPEQSATSDLKNATITFPPGMVVNPSQADGLAACPETGKESVGFTGFAELNPQAEPGVKTAQFTPAPATCPEASKLGTVKIVTPLLDHPIEGGLYLATPHANPFGSLVAVYLAVYDPISGVVIKLPGDVSLNKETGQVSTTFDQNPQLPFEKLEVDLFNDAKRAAFTTPETCGSYSSASVLAPWDGNPAAKPASEHPFQISSLPGGGACPATEAQAPNAPGLSAGTVSPIAGTYSPFVLKLTRQDGSQRFGALDVTLPEGMIGKVAGVEECPQADIEAAEHLTAEGDGAVEVAHPSCPAGSAVGVVHVGAGSGAPFFVNGTAYFAGPYKGAPFSIVFVTPAIAGPFDLGVVTVRAALYINPETAQVTVKSDPFPTILDGIPLDIRSVGVEMTRPDFTLNPTSCNVMAVSGVMTSTAGQYAPLSDRFQVGGCNGMPFRPSLQVSTSAHTSRKDGASLNVQLTYPSAPAGTYSNLRFVEVQLPEGLPSRLETLKQACPEAVFKANPAGCPAGSVVGHAVVHTPVLPVALEGPAYFVSYGGAKWPELVLVLQGDGVTIQLNGKTRISKGVTSSTFPATPDVPFESFDLSLPQGASSALDFNGNLCYRTITRKKRVLVRRHGHAVTRHKHLLHKIKKIHRKVRRHMSMPTLMIGQNGVEIHQHTPVQVIGCGKRHTGHKHLNKHHKDQKKHHKHKRGRHAKHNHHGHGKHAKRRGAHGRA